MIKDKFFYTIILLLLIFWAIGLFIYSVGAIIHLLLMIVLISTIIKYIQRKKTTQTLKKTKL